MVREPAVQYLILAACAAVLALVVTPLVASVARRVGALDEAADRRVHAHAIPRLGGLAILAAGAATFALAPTLGVPITAPLHAARWNLSWLLVGVAVITTAGVFDDVRGLRPLPKLAWQIAAATLVVAGGYGVDGVDNPFTGNFASLGMFGAAASVLWIVLVTNALNLIDGLDGLATGVALIITLTLFGVSLVEQRLGAACLWAILGGALAGFLRYNFSPASIFLGDSGSMLLGFLLAVLSLKSLEKSALAVVLTVPILALGFPIIEVALTLVRRTLTTGVGSVTRGDRQHIHDRLLESGVSQRRAVLILYAVCATFGGLAFLALLIRGPANAIIVGIGAVLMWMGIRAAGYGRSPR
jgi:UDP-GlcNAc:undecaprenyl-phosphate GlcNAc-1-phosphate transferase